MKIERYLSFDDVLIKPQFSTIKSRKDVDLSVNFCDMNLKLGVISSNMDTVTGTEMAKAMIQNGGVGALHRFMSIEDNIKQFKSSGNAIVSIGLGDKELERAEALYKAGAKVFLIDVAHGASMEVVNQTKRLSYIVGWDSKIIVGNFATGRTIKDFIYHVGSKHLVEAYKVGIGGGSACLTRVVTGCGIPTFGSVLDCASIGVNIIADGGMRNSGDIAKALAAGAKVVMLGGMLAGTDESPGDIIYGPSLSTGEYSTSDMVPKGKKYRGSASTESYEVQGKVAAHRSYEGDSFLVPYKGPVANVLQQIEGGLRSAMSYVNANTLDEFRENVEFIEVTHSGAAENSSHGKKN